MQSDIDRQIKGDRLFKTFTLRVGPLFTTTDSQPNKCVALINFNKQPSQVPPGAT